jgi:hypothetical protein
VTQVRADVTGLVEEPGEDPTRDSLKAVVKKLADKDQTVKDFVARTGN